MSIDFEEMTASDFRAKVAGYTYSEISGNTVHESIGPIWYWVGRYMDQANDNCQVFWNIYTNSTKDMLAIEWLYQGKTKFKESRRVLVRNWKDTQ
jgi:hypothetical protein